ncbi:allantoate amidohydrolase [Cryobacterium sp. 1639]|uniref:allantoate amidohydrolase n=1 Tax=Cryobacterium inferilacus TaxID=2866629 RepID=UPI001C735530|nr:allantoate amidohydrolase [Cryobacterium sp. 1639]MBX0298748.1 allantoate amidohydrolase [Cryobacterium sp. 1639]
MTLPAETTGSGRTTASAVLDRCDELATHSSAPDGLIERVYLSPEHAAVNALAAGWMRDAGMTTWQDAAGNQCGRLEGATPGLPALLLGSHLDTVPSAGRYDGILGVLSAIAVVERIAAGGCSLPFALEVVAFGDEEGTRFGTALLGSRALAGTWLDAWWELTDDAGTTLHDAFTDFGLDPAAITAAARSSNDFVGYLEVHIEQGPVLEERDLPLGVVSSIAGARRFQITITGKAGHSGTPWSHRRDALAGASEAIVAIERLARDADLIATVGHLEVFPDAVNVIAGRAEFSLDLRGRFDADRDAVWQQIEAMLEEICAARGLHVAVHQTHAAPAAHCSDRLRGVIAAGIEVAGLEAASIRAAEDDEPDPAPEPVELLSMAGHDAMAVAHLTEIGMLFVRCAGGVSHHPDESVTEADVAQALDAFEAAVLALAAGSAAGSAADRAAEDSA